MYYSAADRAVVHAIDWNREEHWHVLSVSASLDPISDVAARSAHEVSLEHRFGRFRIAHFDTVDLAVLVRHVDSPGYAIA